MKASAGNFFEDFKLGQKLVHATPRTLTTGDAAVYAALYGSRFILQSSEAFARKLGMAQRPLDDLLVFHTIFGKTVADISRNAVANLGYAELRFLKPVFVGSTLRAVSEVIGLKENSNGKTGVVYVRTEGFDDHDDKVLSYVRWVMVNKRDFDADIEVSHVPTLAAVVTAESLIVLPEIDFRRFDTTLSGSDYLWEDYEIGEKIDHIDGMTIENAGHMLAAKLYQNNARVHLNDYTERWGRFGHRLVYGGHIISMARALSFNGLANTVFAAAVNGGHHANPAFAGDTVFAWSEVLDKAPVAGRDDCGALRLRLAATKELPCNDFPLKDERGDYLDEVLLDLDYWAIMPRRA